MAKLADDWPSERHSCVDVLCAYLRMPWPESDDANAEAEVRRSIAMVMSDHLHVNAPITWSDIAMDFSNQFFARLSSLSARVRTTGARCEY